MKTDHSEILREARELAAAIHPHPDLSILPTADTCKKAAAMLCTLAYIIETYESRYADIPQTFLPLPGGVEGGREATMGQQREDHACVVCGSYDLSVSRNEPIKCGQCDAVRKE